MNRKKKLMLNTVLSTLNQIAQIVSGLILPGFFLRYYGSSAYGLQSSIIQFLSFITLSELGVGAVVQSNLYKPLAKNDKDCISKIIVASDKFFKNVAYILIIYVLGLAITYPFIALDKFDYFYSASLIVILSGGTFIQYYFCMSYKLLLDADQKSYVQVVPNIIALIINTIGSLILIKYGFGIHVVKLFSVIVFLLKPMVVVLYIKKHYSIDKKIIYSEEPIKQKWNGLSQHIAAVVLKNTDVVVLTLFSTLENVSIYSVYVLVVNGFELLIESMTVSVTSFFGNLLAEEEIEKISRAFDYMEWLLHTGVTAIYTVTALLIVPFVRVYTLGITDANYIVPTFAYVITIAHALYCIRIPYHILIKAANMYKETQISALIEAGLNLLISIICVSRFGLVGVAIGTLIAMSYRLIFYALFIRKTIIHRNLKYFIKHFVIDSITAALIVYIVRFINFQCSSFGQWTLLALKVFAIAMSTILLINCIFYKSKLIYTGEMLFRKKSIIKQDSGNLK